MSILGTPVSSGDAGATTLAVVRAQVRQRADMVYSTFCTDAEINSYIAASYYELYDLLIEKWENYAVAPPVTFQTNGVDDSYGLPTDFYKLLGVDVKLGGSWATLGKFSMADRNKYQLRGGLTLAWGRTSLRYQLLGNDIWLAPLPASGLTLRLFYIPRLIAPTNDSDVIDGIDGWEEYIVVDAAIKCMQKEESDCTVLMNQKAALLQRIESAAANRDAGQPKTTSITQDYGWDDGYGNGGWY